GSPAGRVAFEQRARLSGIARVVRPDRVPRLSGEERLEGAVGRLEGSTGESPRLTGPAERGGRLGGDDQGKDRVASARQERRRCLPRPGQVARPPADLGEVEQTI